MSPHRSRPPYQERRRPAVGIFSEVSILTTNILGDRSRRKDEARLLATLRLEGWQPSGIFGLAVAVHHPMVVRSRIPSLPIAEVEPTSLLWSRPGALKALDEQCQHLPVAN